MEESKATRTPRRWWPVVKWSLFALIMAFVVRRAVLEWQASPRIEIKIDARWLVPAACAYLIGWIPSVWFWHALMKSMDQRPAAFATIRAYFVGHMGKYVPGKALVLVLRGALIKDSGASSMLGALAAAYETLVSMAAGATIAVALAPAVITTGMWDRLPASFHWLRDQPLLVPLVAAAAALASTPLSAWLFTRVGRKALPRTEDAPATAAISARLVALGLFVTSLGWVCHAFSLGFTLQAISDGPMNLEQFPVWLASVAMSTFAGFVVLVAPGGLGVREWVLIETLKDQPGIGTERAIVAAWLLRVVWLVAELIAAGGLFAIKPGTRSKQ